jgi:hypothetical protein
MQLRPKALALTCGVLWGGCLAFLAFIAMSFDYGTPLLDLLSTVYRGTSPTVPGMVAGFLWGFVDGVICGFLFAKLYNYFLTKGQNIRR